MKLPAPTNGNGLSRAVLWLGVIVPGIAVVTSLAGTVWWVSTMSNTVNNLLASNVALTIIVNENRSEIAKIRLDNAKQTKALDEIETQFCASDIVRNLMHANDMRTSAMLWEKAFGTRLPTDNAYYPRVCNRQPEQR